MEIIKINDEEYVPKEAYDKLAKPKKEKDINKVIESREFYSHDPANVMLIGKIEDMEADEFKLKFIKMKFLADNKNIKLLLDISGDNKVLTITKDGEEWAKISKEYYDKACKIIREWKGAPDVHVQNKKDSPVLIRGDDLAFILAPRVVQEDGDES